MGHQLFFKAAVTAAFFLGRQQLFASTPRCVSDATIKRECQVDTTETTGRVRRNHRKMPTTNRRSHNRLQCVLLTQKGIFRGYLCTQNNEKLYKMKKKMTALFAAIVLFATATFATGNPEPSTQVQERFNLMFAKSTGAQWELVSDFYKVSFVHAGQHLVAYYNAAGDFESVSRNITVHTLPVVLQTALKGKLGDAWVSEGLEVSGNNGTSYYVTVENADEKTIYYSHGVEWAVFKRTQK